MYASAINASRIGICAGYGPGGRPSIGKPITTWSNMSMWSYPICSMAWARRITPFGPSRYETLGNSTVSFMARSIYAQVLAQVETALHELGGRALDDDAPAVEHHDVVRHVEHELRVLLDQHDREPLRLEPADRRHDLRDDLRRQPLGRLVHQEDARVRHERAPDREHLLLAARER